MLWGEGPGEQGAAGPCCVRFQKGKVPADNSGKQDLRCRRHPGEPSWLCPGPLCRTVALVLRDKVSDACSTSGPFHRGR